MVFLSNMTDTSDRLVNALLLKPFNLTIWLTWLMRVPFVWKKMEMPIKRSSQFNPLPATSEIKEKCYFCIRMVSRKTNAGRPQPPSAHWYLFCKFCFTLCWCDRVTAFINRFCRLQRKKMIRMFYKPEKYFPIIACLLRKAISMLKSNSLH